MLAFPLGWYKIRAMFTWRRQTLATLFWALVFVARMEAAVHYVNVNATNPSPAYLAWETAAATIQDAIDSALPGDEVVVTNGVYKTGGRAVDGGSTNRIVIPIPILVRSVNGPAVTLIEGGGSSDMSQPGTARCARLASGATLAGFTLTNGSVWLKFGDPIGAGVSCESVISIVSNCVITSCASSGFGGGVYSGTLLNCTVANCSGSYGGGVAFANLFDSILLTNTGSAGAGAWGCCLTRCTIVGNSTWGDSGGGGAASSMLTNCLLLGNYGVGGGGARRCALNSCTVVSNLAASGGGINNFSGGEFLWGVTNSIVYYNNSSNPERENYWGDIQWANSCTYPQPDSATNTFTNAPGFVDLSRGNFRLQRGSPCIDAGGPPDFAGPFDRDGRKRFVNGQIDIGAFEFDPEVSGEYLQWLYSFGLPTDAASDQADPDEDGAPNLSEWLSGTNPVSSNSVLRLLPIRRIGQMLELSWLSVPGRTYCLERGLLALDPEFTTLQSNIVAGSNLTSVTDTNSVDPRFYRVAVQR